MSRFSGAFRECRRGLAGACKSLSWAAALVLALGGCGRDSDMPNPPQSPPRPVTYGGGKAFTAQLDLPARPVPPPPGEM